MKNIHKSYINLFVNLKFNYGYPVSQYKNDILGRFLQVIDE